MQYDNTGDDDKPDLPFAIRVVDKVTQEDGLGHAYTTRYFYEDGYFEPGVREFRGFGHVKVIDAEDSVKETEFYQDDFRKGRPKRELVKDRYDRLYSETRYRWHYAGTDEEPEYRLVWDEQITFPTLEEKTTTVFDPQNEATTKSTKTIYDYDTYGNAKTITEYGFDDVSGDERETSIEYDYNTEKWMLSKPKITELKSSSGKVVSATKYTYDDKGSLITEEKWLSDTPSGSPTWGLSRNPTTEFTYDDYGNVTTVTDARGKETKTAYKSDTEVNPHYTFPKKVENALGHTQQFKYDPATGKITESIDPNGQVTKSTYDSFGRLVNVVGPASVSEVSHTYDLEIGYDPDKPGILIDPAKIVTTTKVSGADSIKAISFSDGLGRQILSRIEAKYKGNDKHIVSGEVEYDSRGQVIKKYLPYYIDKPPLDDEDKYFSPLNSTPYMTYEYNAMGGLVKTIRPDSKASYIIYDLNKVTSINENNQKTRQTKDAFGRIVTIEEFNEDEDGNEVIYTTTYEYDTLGNLIKTIDNVANEVTIDYDTLGRKISMQDPDMGGFKGKKWTYEYDKVGNLETQTDAKEQVITFQYDAINRLTYKSTGVTYDYDNDAETDPNNQYFRIGRLRKVRDSSGETEFFYDELGRETRTKKTISDKSYEIVRTYNSLDYLTSVKYPDNSTVSYTYNKQGGIETISSGSKDYVKFVDYNANGQIERIEYGNGTSTTYDYDPYNFRLDHLETRNADGLIQDLSYNFDPIGNVTSIIDSVLNSTNTQYFQYDNINRLTYANGASYGIINYEYNSIGNMTTKGDITMTYGNGAGPHAVTSYTKGGVTYPIGYDDNGNMASKGSATYEYDIENRLERVILPNGGGSFDITINLQEGWNLFSLPGNIPNSGGAIKTILSSLENADGTTKYEQVSGYDPTTDRWTHFVNLEKFNDFDKFTYGEGYLIYMKEATTLNLSGFFPLEEQTKTLKADKWTLICAPTDTTIDKDEALAGVTYDGLKVWNGTGYDDATTLEAGKSYWVHIPDTAGNQSWTPPLPEVTTTYLYDGDNGRVMRHVEDEDPTFYIGSSFEFEGDKPDEPADKVTKHIFMGSTRICSVETEAGQNNIYFYHTDQIQSSNVITDENGAVVNILEYTPYGLVSRDTGKYSTDKRFTGKIWDGSSFLYYYGARYYDPQIGRFITADPTVQRPYDPQDFNRYQYARSNPVKYIDSTGYFWHIIIGAIIGAIVGAVTAAVTGGNVLEGMATGAVAGALFAFVGNFGLTGLSQIVAHAYAGAASGAINATITGDNSGWGALVGGASAGVAAGLGNVLPSASGKGFNSFLANLTRRAVIGAAVGGSASAIVGGNFWSGAKTGAMTAAIAYTANDVLHSIIDKASNIKIPWFSKKTSWKDSKGPYKRQLHVNATFTDVTGPIGSSAWTLRDTYEQERYVTYRSVVYDKSIRRFRIVAIATERQTRVIQRTIKSGRGAAVSWNAGGNIEGPDVFFAEADGRVVGGTFNE